MTSSNKSGFRGVHWATRRGRWQAQITNSGVHRHLGYFETSEEAARAYDVAALSLHGAFAQLNFPSDQESRNDRVA